MEKTVISQELFEKKVEIEAQNLMYFEYMKKLEAFVKARKRISEEYSIS